MTNIFYINDILYQINHYLSLNEKLKFILINRYVFKISKNIRFLHIGQILSNQIGFENTESDIILIRSISLEVTKEIIKYLESPIVIKSSIIKIPLGIILKISNSTKENCIKKLKTKELFRNNIPTKKYILNSYLIKKYFPNIYPLLD